MKLFEEGKPSYYQRNKEKERARQREYYAKRKLSPNYTEIKERQRDFKLRRDFGIPLGEYREMLVTQKECCAICGEHQDKKGKLLAVDHCHSTGKVRGLLCLNCNIVLGHVKEDITILEKMVLYIRSNNAQAI